jgi:hypothetical protein
MRRLALAFVCAGLLAAAYAPAASAATVLPVSGQMVVVGDFISDGVEGMRGAPTAGTPIGDVPFTVYSKRDMVLKSELIPDPGVSGYDYVAGIETSHFGYQLNFRTWHGSGFGSTRIEPAAYPAGWFTCSLSYVYVGGFPPAWRGHEVCHGQGTLDGVQLRLDLAHDSLTFETTFTGYVLMPRS